MIEFPKLYKKTSTGAIQEWQIRVDIINDIPNIINYYGQVGGKIQESREQVFEGKNTGKANATTAIEQAVAQAKARREKQLKKGYVNSIEDAMAGKIDEIIEGGIFPMLAHKFSEQGDKIKYPALAQPKLDGHRCISQNTDEVSLWSRTRKPIKSVPHIIKALKAASLPYKYLDGELWHPDINVIKNESNFNFPKEKITFEKITSLIRQDKPMEGHEVVQYHVYDIPDGSMTNLERATALALLTKRFINTPIHIVETIIVNNEDELMEAFDHFIELGYEGCMVRNANGMYVNKRSYDLQKVKEFDDSEFKIVGIKVGNKGSMAGKAVFTCEIPNTVNTFDCKLKGNMDELIRYAEEPSLVIGKILTVKYQGLTKYGKPRFPVGLRFREDI